MSLKDDVSDPWGLLVAGLAGGAAWAVGIAGAAAAAVGVAVLGVKVTGERLLGRPRRRLRARPAGSQALARRALAQPRGQLRDIQTLTCCRRR